MYKPKKQRFFNWVFNGTNAKLATEEWVDYILETALCNSDVDITEVSDCDRINVWCKLEGAICKSLEAVGRL